MRSALSASSLRCFGVSLLGSKWSDMSSTVMAKAVLMVWPGKNGAARTVIVPLCIVGSSGRDELYPDNMIGREQLVW